jgi:hypothetical protein
MVENSGSLAKRQVGRWSARVAFSESGGFAYRPDELLLPHTRADDAWRILSERADLNQKVRPVLQTRKGSFVLCTQVDAPLRALGDLEAESITAGLNYVLFSDCLCCCGPHPANPFGANPFGANPFGANPFGANPFGANPFGANPFGANPYSASDFQPNPLYRLAYGGSHPDAVVFRATGWRSHSAHPSTAPDLPSPTASAQDRSDPTIVVIDTGIAHGDLMPQALTGVAEHDSGRWTHKEEPDEDHDERIDSVAGHGTFIAGIIERIAPGCRLQVHGLLGGYGDASEEDVADTLESLLEHGPPMLLNLSFSGYAPVNMPRLGEAVRKLQDAGTVVVASAGNDATCQPAYPAAFPDVVSVGALGPHGPASFTNYGPWVRACAPGVDVVSTFFKEWKSPTGKDEEFAGWARWSGTSFAAPAVVGALARSMRDGLDGQQAVEQLIDAPGLFRIPGLGAVVNEVPRWQRG